LSVGVVLSTDFRVPFIAGFLSCQS